MDEPTVLDLLADFEKTLAALRALPKENTRLARERDEAEAKCESWRDRFPAIAGEDRPDMAGNRVLKLKDEVARLEGLIRDALSCDPAVRPVEWVEWRIRATKGE